MISRAFARQLRVLGVCHPQIQNGRLFPQVYQPEVIKSRGMAGHAKWQNIKHTKAAKDAEFSRITNKINVLIAAAVRDGGVADPRLNSRLGKVVEMARSHNISSSIIDKAIKKAQANQENAQHFNLEYESFNGSFLIVEVITGNVKHLKQKLRSMGKKYGFRETTSRGAKHAFEEKGIVVTPGSEDKIHLATDHAIEVGAEDVVCEDGKFMFTCDPDSFPGVKNGLVSLGYEIEYANVDFLPVFTVSIDESYHEKIDKAIACLQEIDEVIKVYTNIE